MVYGVIGPKLNEEFPVGTLHDYSSHFNQSMPVYHEGFKNAADIIARELPNMKHPKDFEDLYDWVCTKLSKKNNPGVNLNGIGLLALYDISLNIGCNLYPKVLPKKYVYIHDNLHKEAEAVLGRTLTDRNIVDASLFSNVLPHCSAMEIEDVLCVYSGLILCKGGFDKEWLKEIPQKFNFSISNR